MTFAVVVALVCMATHRLTVLAVNDEITRPWRAWVEHRYGVMSKRFYLVSCPWCMSFWIAAVVAGITAATAGLPYPVLVALTASSVTALLPGWD